MVCDDSPEINFACKFFVLTLPEHMLIDFREREWEGEREGGKCQ